MAPQNNSTCSKLHHEPCGKLFTTLHKQDLRERVIRGANEHPGAIAIENEAGQVVRLDKLPRHRREAAARLLLTPTSSRGSIAAGAAASNGGLHSPDKLDAQHKG